MQVMKEIKNLKKKLIGETRLRNPWNNGRYGNMKCFCGSQVKLKRCHGKERTLDKSEMEEARKLFDKWEDSPEGVKFFKEKRGEK